MTAQPSVESDFIESWDSIEEFYDDLLTYKGWEHVKPVRDLINHLRTLGYDKLLRAGQSVHILILSRARHSGLRKNQHRIGIEATHKNTFRIRYVIESTINEFETEELISNKDLYGAINQLLKEQID